MTQRSDSFNIPVPPWGLAVTAILSVQLGSALSVNMIEAVGPGGTAWLRLSMGAIILLAIGRPPLRSIRRPDVLPLLGLGVTTGVMTVGFLAAVEHIHLGTAVAIEFLGPLTVAALRSHNRKALAWPAVALVGVVLLTQPWQGDFNLVGVAWAALAAVGWGF
ncbi:EamA family transporter [Pseudarthrobacter siccitolerans]